MKINDLLRIIGEVKKSPKEIFVLQPKNLPHPSLHLTKLDYQILVTGLSSAGKEECCINANVRQAYGDKLLLLYSIPPGSLVYKVPSKVELEDRELKEEIEKLKK